jgi:hypothetical protein
MNDMAINASVTSSSISIPDITDTQRRAFSRYLDTHRQSDSCSRAPMRLALVVGQMKPATIIEPYPWAFPDCALSPVQCFQDLLDRFDCVYRQPYGAAGVIVAGSTGRLEFLPTVKNTDSDAYHRRLGVLFGYPPDAIEAFIQDEEPPTQPHDLVADGLFEVEALAYTSFVFYKPADSAAAYEQTIAEGKMTRARLGMLADEWQLPALDEIADTIYEAYVAEYTNVAEEI